MCQYDRAKRFLFFLFLVGVLLTCSHVHAEPGSPPVLDACVDAPRPPVTVNLVPSSGTSGVVSIDNASIFIAEREFVGVACGWPVFLGKSATGKDLIVWGMGIDQTMEEIQWLLIVEGKPAYFSRTHVGWYFVHGHDHYGPHEALDTEFLRYTFAHGKPLFTARGENGWSVWWGEKQLAGPFEKVRIVQVDDHNVTIHYANRGYEATYVLIL